MGKREPEDLFGEAQDDFSARSHEKKSKQAFCYTKQVSLCTNTAYYMFTWEAEKANCCTAHDFCFNNENDNS